jgi:hypothetical protein
MSQTHFFTVMSATAARQKLKRTLFVAVAGLAAFLEGWFLGPIGFDVLAGGNGDHHCAGNWLDAHVLGCAFAVN